MSWVNLNSVFNAVADEQGLEPGSGPWTAGGMMAYSGQTGGHPSYGWNHSCKLSPEYVKAVIANYGHRACYYAPLEGEPALMIQGGYLNGGRPFGWKPEDPAKDLPTGERVYLTSTGVAKVSGPDVQHFQMGPLFAVADSKGYFVKAQGKEHRAELIAQIMIRFLMSTSAGQVRGGKGYLWGDRGVAMIVLNAARAAKRGLINPSDAVDITNWLVNHCLPFYEKAPGHNVNTKDNGLPAPNFQIYNGLYYLMPAFREAYGILQGDLKLRVGAILKRFSQWLVDLDAIVPDYNLDIFAFAATEELQAGINGKPFPSLAGKITKEQIGGGPGGSDWSLWGFTAAMIAEEQLGEAAKPVADRLRAKWLPLGGKLDTKVYLVGANGEYV